MFKSTEHESVKMLGGAGVTFSNAVNLILKLFMNIHTFLVTGYKKGKKLVVNYIMCILKLLYVTLETD